MKRVFSPYNFDRSPMRRFAIYVLIGTGLLCLFWGIYLHAVPSDAKKTIWAIDTSLSVQVQDMMTSSGVMLSRLSVIQDILATSWKEQGWSHAIMTFWSNAKVLSPLTDDGETLSSIITSLTPEIYSSSSDISSLFTLIALLYPEEPLSVVVFTDGENMILQSTGSLELKDKSFTFVWVGTVAGWPMLQGYDSDGKPRYKQFEWQNAISRRDDAFLSNLAQVFNGNTILIDDAKNIASITNNPISWIFDRRTLFLLIGTTLILVWLFLPPVRYHTSVYAKK